MRPEWLYIWGAASIILCFKLGQKYYLSGVLELKTIPEFRFNRTANLDLGTFFFIICECLYLFNNSVWRWVILGLSLNCLAVLLGWLSGQLMKKGWLLPLENLDQ